MLYFEAYGSGLGCYLSQESWVGSDCSSSDSSCTAQASALDYFVSTLADFMPAETGCVAVWLGTGGEFGVCHYALITDPQQTQSLGTGNAVPVDITLTFTAVGGGGPFPLFVTCQITE